MKRVALLVAVAGLASIVHADDRRFVFLDEARVTPPGAVEFEQWVTWRGHTRDEHSSSIFELKEELEVGIRDNLQIGVEIPAWHFQNSPRSQKQGPRLDAIAADCRWVICDPNKDPLGVAVKPEIGISEDEFSLEARLTLQKNFDKVELVYNATVEGRWVSTEDKRYSEREGEFNEALGVSVEVASKIFVGAEILHEAPMPDWHTGEHQNLFVGPNASIHWTNCAVTFTPLFRLTGGHDEGLFLFRFVFEADF